MAMGLSEAAAANGVNRSPIYRAWKAGRISATRTSSMRIINGLLALACSVSMVAPSYAAGVGKGEGQVDIVAWPGYIERGDSDKNYDWVTDFEKKTGCKVNVKTAGTSDEMVALMNEGGFDLVTASGDASLRRVGGSQQPLRPGAPAA